jgi:hypothetical protein
MLFVSLTVILSSACWQPRITILLGMRRSWPTSIHSLFTMNGRSGASNRGKRGNKNSKVNLNSKVVPSASVEMQAPKSAAHRESLALEEKTIGPLISQ